MDLSWVLEFAEVYEDCCGGGAWYIWRELSYGWLTGG